MRGLLTENLMSFYSLGRGLRATIRLGVLCWFQWWDQIHLSVYRRSSTLRLGTSIYRNWHFDPDMLGSISDGHTFLSCSYSSIVRLQSPMVRGDVNEAAVIATASHSPTIQGDGLEVLGLWHWHCGTSRSCKSLTFGTLKVSCKGAVLQPSVV